MAEVKGARQWFKVFGSDYLYGTTRKELTPTERSIWIDLLALASTSIDDGKVCLSIGVGYPLEAMSKTLDIPLKTLQTAITKMEKANKIRLLKDGVIEIVNWAKYQSEWDRLKDYPSQKGSRGLGENVGFPVGINVGGSTSTSTSNSMFDKDFIEKIEKQDPIMVYWYCFGHRASCATMTTIAEYTTQYGKAKTIRAMVTIGKGGYRFGNVERVLKGEWNQTRGNKVSRDTVDREGEVV